MLHGENLLEKRERILGQDHPDTFKTIHGLALTCQAYGNDKSSLEASTFEFGNVPFECKCGCSSDALCTFNIHRVPNHSESKLAYTLDYLSRESDDSDMPAERDQASGMPELQDCWLSLSYSFADIVLARIAPADLCHTDRHQAYGRGPFDLLGG